MDKLVSPVDARNCDDMSKNIIQDSWSRFLVSLQSLCTDF